MPTRSSGIMEMVEIPMQRFEELLRKEASYEMKKQELKRSSYVSEIDRVLFQCWEESASAEDDF